MLRQVLPNTVVAGIGYDELSGDYTSANAIADQFDDSNDINNYAYRRPRPASNKPVRKESMPPTFGAPDSANRVPNYQGDTSGWNPFTWFAPKIRSIPYNPDTDLQTVSVYIYIQQILFFLIAILSVERVRNPALQTSTQPNMKPVSLRSLLPTKNPHPKNKYGACRNKSDIPENRKKISRFAQVQYDIVCIMRAYVRPTKNTNRRKPNWWLSALREHEYA